MLKSRVIYCTLSLGRPWIESAVLALIELPALTETMFKWLFLSGERIGNLKDGIHPLKMQLNLTLYGLGHCSLLPDVLTLTHLKRWKESWPRTNLCGVSWLHYVQCGKLPWVNVLLGLSQMIIVGQKNNILSGGKGPLYSTRSCLCISVFLSLIIL